ncbi:MAG: malate dehydrogenase [Helicobacteraceae bacterium]
MDQKTKISVYGAGNVGATLAFLLGEQALADEVVVIDIEENIAQGKGLDIQEAMPIFKSSASVRGAKDPKEIEGSAIVVITAGFPRKPGMSRDDLLLTNKKIVWDIGQDIKKYAPGAIVIVVTNPLDAMTYVALKSTGFARSRVIGMGGILDSARMSAFIREKIGNGHYEISTAVLGGHGDLMVPLINYCKISGKPLSDFLSKGDIDAIVERTKNGGAEIVGYLKTGSAYYAPASSVVLMCKSILGDEQKVYPCSVMLESEYGASDTVGGVMVSLGINGVEKIVEIELSADEKAAFEASVNKTKQMIEVVRN